MNGEHIICYTRSTKNYLRITSSINFNGKPNAIDATTTFMAVITTTLIFVVRTYANFPFGSRCVVSSVAVSSLPNLLFKCARRERRIEIPMNMTQTTIRRQTPASAIQRNTLSLSYSIVNPFDAFDDNNNKCIRMLHMPSIEYERIANWTRSFPIPSPKWFNPRTRRDIKTKFPGKLLFASFMEA